MINLLRVSSEVALQTVGVLLDLPGGTKGYLEIDEEDEKSCENALKMIEKRVRFDLSHHLITSTRRLVLNLVNRDGEIFWSLSIK